MGNSADITGTDWAAAATGGQLREAARSGRRTPARRRRVVGAPGPSAPLDDDTPQIPDAAPAPVPAPRSVLSTAAHALALAERVAADAAEDKYRSDLLRDLISGRIADPARYLPADHGFGGQAHALVVVVAEPDPADTDDAAALRRLQDALARAWGTALRGAGREASVVSYPHEVVAVLGTAEDDCGTNAARDGAARARAALTALGRTFTTGISRPTAGLDGIACAYEQARRALTAGRRIHGPGSVADFDQLGVFRLLSLIPDPAELDRFAVEALGVLARPRDADAEDLRRTLQALLDTNLNVAETSRRLYLHYNTLRYRITKLERLVGPFTQDPHLRLNLLIALQIVRLQG